MVPSARHIMPQAATSKSLLSSPLSICVSASFHWPHALKHCTSGLGNATGNKVLADVLAMQVTAVEVCAPPFQRVIRGNDPRPPDSSQHRTPSSENPAAGTVVMAAATCELGLKRDICSVAC